MAVNLWEIISSASQTEAGKVVREYPLVLLEIFQRDDYEELLLVAMQYAPRVTKLSHFKSLIELGRRTYRHWRGKAKENDLKRLYERWIDEILRFASEYVVQCSCSRVLSNKNLPHKKSTWLLHSHVSKHVAYTPLLSLFDDKDIPYQVRKAMAERFVGMVASGHNFGMVRYGALDEAFKLAERFFFSERIRQQLARELIKEYLNGGSYDKTGRAAAEYALRLAEEYWPEKVKDVAREVVRRYENGDRFNLKSEAAARFVRKIRQQYLSR